MTALASRPRIALCSADESVEELRDMLARHFDVKVKACKNEDDVIEFAADADGILLDLLPISAKAMDLLSKCKTIVLYSDGYDSSMSLPLRNAG